MKVIVTNGNSNVNQQEISALFNYHFILSVKSRDVLPKTFITNFLINKKQNLFLEY